MSAPCPRAMSGLPGKGSDPVVPCEVGELETVAAASQPRRKILLVAAVLKLLSAAALATIAASGPVSAQEAAAESPPAGVRGPDVAVRRRVLMNNLGQIQAALATLDQRKPTLDELRAQVEELIDEVNAIPTARRPEAQKDEENPKAGAKKVPFRPPLMQAAAKDPRGVIFCENNRATPFDMNPVDSFVEKDKARLRAAFQGGTPAQGTWVLPSEHFDVKYSVQSQSVDMEIVRKEGPEHLGETLDEACKPGSAVIKAMREFDARKTYLQFMVYPDGYDVFRAVRTEARNLKLDVRWVPKAAGAAIFISGGSGTKD